MAGKCEAFLPQERRRLELAHAGADAEDDALDRLRCVACGELEGGELFDLVRGAEPGGSVHQERRSVCDAAGWPNGGAQRIGDKGGDLEPGVGVRRFGRREILPADRSDGRAGSDARVGKELGKRRRAAPILSEQAERWIKPDVEADRRRVCSALVLRPGEEHWIAARYEDQQRFLEARIEAGQKSEIGEVLPVGIDRRRRKSS